MAGLIPSHFLCQSRCHYDIFDFVTALPTHCHQGQATRNQMMELPSMDFKINHDSENYSILPVLTCLYLRVATRLNVHHIIWDKGSKVHNIYYGLPIMVKPLGGLV